MSPAAELPKTKAEIPRSFVEFTINFEQLTYVWEKREPIVVQTLAALKPFGFALDGIEIKTPEKLSDHALIFRRTTPAFPPMSVGLYFGKIFIAAENLDWSQAESFLAMANAGIAALKAVTNFEAQSQVMALGIHVQVKDKSIKDVTASLVTSAVTTLLDGDVTFSGIILNRSKASVSIDLSLAYANALWIRIFREHSGGATLPSIAEALKNDEIKLFEVLGLEENL
jgi:hypothetical protein